MRKAHIRLGGRDFTAFGGGLHDRLECLERGHGEALVALGAAVWQIATQGLAALVQVLHFWGVVCGLVERDLGQLAVGHRDVEAVAEGFDVLV